MADKQYQAGDLDRKGNLYSYDTHKDAVGGIANSLSLIQAGIYCKKTDLTGREKDTNNLPAALGQTEFIVRYKPTIKETMVWECEGIKYDILSVGEVGGTRHQWTRFVAQKRDVNAG